MTNTRRFRPKGVPIPGFRYIKGQGFLELKGRETCVVESFD